MSESETEKICAAYYVYGALETWTKGDYINLEKWCEDGLKRHP